MYFNGIIAVRDGKYLLVHLIYCPVNIGVFLYIDFLSSLFSLLYNESQCKISTIPLKRLLSSSFFIFIAYNYPVYISPQYCSYIFRIGHSTLGYWFCRYSKTDSIDLHTNSSREGVAVTVSTCTVVSTKVLQRPSL